MKNYRNILRILISLLFFSSTANHAQSANVSAGSIFIDSQKSLGIENENEILYTEYKNWVELIKSLGTYLTLFTGLLILYLVTYNRLKKSRRELENSVKELELITNAVPIGMCMVDTDLNVLWSNIEIRKFYGINEDKKEMNFADILPKSFLEKVREILKSNHDGTRISIEGALNPDLSITSEFKKGLLWVKVDYIPVKDFKKKIIKYIVINDDHTQEKLRELELEEKNIEIEAELKTNLSLLSNNLVSIEKAVKAVKAETGISDQIKNRLIRIFDQKMVKKLLVEIDYKFIKANEEFHKKLSEKYPNLTPGNIKLCTYLKMNLSTKEIAVLESTSPNAIKVAKSRLRSKLNDVDSSVSLSTFFKIL